jgi:hypothetical protein
MVVGGALVVAAAVYVAPMVALFVAMTECSYDLKDQQVSPDGMRKAAVVEVNCGATTDYVRWVVATDAKSAFKYRRDRIASVSGRALKIAWEGRKLIVYYPATRPPTVAKRRADVEFRTL